MDNTKYVGITSPETNEPYEKEATEANRKLVEGKEVKLEFLTNAKTFLDRRSQGS